MTQAIVDFLSKLVCADTNEVAKLLQRGFSSEVFPAPYNKIVQYCLEYNTKYGAIPTLLTLTERFAGEADYLSTACSSSPLAALYDKILDDGIRNSLADMSEKLRAKHEDKATPAPELLTFIGKECQEINSTYSKATGVIKDMSSLALELQSDYEATLAGRNNGIPIPFLFIQEEMNGWQKSELTSVAAKTGVGKTWFLTLAAACAAAGDPYIFHRPGDKAPYTAEQKKNAKARVLFVSLEMSVLSIAKRLGAVMTNTSYRRVKAAKLTPAEKTSYFDALQLISTDRDGSAGAGHLIRIVGPNTCKTPDQIHAQAEDFGADLVCVDGFYCMEGTGDHRWEVVEGNMREMRLHTLMTTRHYILSTQLRREATSLKASTTDELSFSSSIAQDSNNVILLVQPEQLRPAKQVNIKFGKIRDGQADCPFRYSWDFDLMLYDEIGEERTSEQGSSQTSY
jgi:replicative DNA helicase